MAKAPARKKAVRRKRAHNSDGSFKADDPSTPEINEAFVQEESTEDESKRREAQRVAGGRYLGGKLVG